MTGPKVFLTQVVWELQSYLPFGPIRQISTRDLLEVAGSMTASVVGWLETHMIGTEGIRRMLDAAIGSIGMVLSVVRGGTTL